MNPSSRPLLHPRDEIVQTMERIYRYRMTTTSGGNLSVRDENGDVWITPARIDKGALRPEDVVCVRADGRVEGLHRPSSEHPFHQGIYRRGPISAPSSTPTRSPWSRSASAARSPTPPCSRRPITSAARSATPPTPCRAASSSAAASPTCSRRAFTASCWRTTAPSSAGPTLQEAFQRFETLEFTAKTAIKAGMLGRVRCLTAEQLALSRVRREPLPEFEPGPASTPRKGTAQGDLRVRAPRLPPAPDDQHRGQPLRPARRGFVAHHLLPGRPPDDGRGTPDAGPQRPARGRQAAEPGRPDPPGDLPPASRDPGGRQRHPGQRHRLRRRRRATGRTHHPGKLHPPARRGR